MAFTHLQPAEPTTIGYRLAQYGQDLLMDLQELRRVRDGIRGKGLKGAVGTSASYRELLGPANVLEDEVMRDLGPGGLAGDYADLPAQAGMAGAQRPGGAGGVSASLPWTFGCCKARPSVSGRSLRAAAGGFLGHALRVIPSTRKR